MDARMRRALTVFAAALILFLLMPGGVRAQEEQPTREWWERIIEQQLRAADYSDVERSVRSMESPPPEGFLGLVRSLISGQGLSAGGIWQQVAQMLGAQMGRLRALMLKLVALALLMQLANNIKPGKSEAVQSAIKYAGIAAVILILSSEITELLIGSRAAIRASSDMTQGVLPILLGLMAAGGNVNAVGAFQPAIATLGSIIVWVIDRFAMALAAAACIIALVGRLLGNDALAPMGLFLRSAVKWVIGLCFAVYVGVLAASGGIAVTLDGVGARTMRYALDTMVPVVGSVLSETLGTVYASSLLIKNGVGLAGLLLIAQNCLPWILQAAGLILAMRLCAGLISPMGNTAIPGVLSDCASALTMVVACIIAGALLLVVTLGMLMLSSSAITMLR